MSQLIPNLAKFEYLDDLELSNNELETIPENIKELKTLTCLNITKNKIDDIEKLVESLKFVPKLNKLYIDIKSGKDFDYIVNSLPQLEFLNDKSLKIEGPKEDMAIMEKGSRSLSSSGTKSFTKDDLEKFEILLELIKKNVVVQGFNADAEYKDGLSGVSTALARSASETEDSPSARKAMYLKEKYGLAGLFFNWVMKAQSPEISAVLGGIKKIQDEVVKNLIDLIADQKSNVESEIIKYKERHAKIEKDLVDALNAFKKIQIETDKALKDKATEVEVAKNDKKEIENKMAVLEAINRRHLATIVKYSKVAQIAGQGSIMNLETSYSPKQEVKPTLGTTV